MSAPRLKTVFRPLGHTQPLLDGTVTPSGFEMDYIEVPVLVKAFRRMVRDLEFDICELAMTTYLCARAHGKRFTALPIFPARGLHHGAILYNRHCDIRSPKDLEGKRVGVNRGYTVTTGVWARGILHDEHDVDLDRVTWVLSGDEHVEEYQAPSNVVSMDPDTTLADMLADGRIAAAIGVQMDHPDVAPLIDDPDSAAFAALTERGLYPINHTVVVRDELLQENPDLAIDVFNAFAEAKRHYMEQLREGTIDEPTAADRLNQRVMEVTGDPLPYGIEPNRSVLETLVGHAHRQRIIPEPVAVDDLFATGTRGLTA